MPSTSPAAPARALFSPRFVGEGVGCYGKHALLEEREWVRMVEAQAHYQLDDWLATMHDWIRYPERNSSNIRRCEILCEEHTSGKQEVTRVYRCIRKILPRRTQIDQCMLQECSIYTSTTHGVAVYTTLRASDEMMKETATFGAYNQSDFPQRATDVPYYHPAVRCLAFHFLSAENGKSQVSVDIIPFSEASSPTHLDENGRIGRTALSLLRLMHKHSYGHATSYVKRVVHDVLVPRDDYQDLYIELRMKYSRNLIETWEEVTDPKKHVFEDLGIAAYLMLLWKEMFSTTALPNHSLRSKRWGEPPGGFVDLGCGNGLLVYILNQEVRAELIQGYAGYGMDARARKSWESYKKRGARLFADLINAPAIVRREISLPTGAFLIGNHADELTPWIPLLASSTPNCSGFINIPCCAWTLEGSRFVPTRFNVSDVTISEMVLGEPSNIEAEMPAPPHVVPTGTRSLLAHTLWFVHRLITTPGQSGHSKHLAYYAYIATLHMRSGWCFESEALRIPSTKNWALIGRCFLDAFNIPGKEQRAAHWNDLTAHALRHGSWSMPHPGNHD